MTIYIPCEVIPVEINDIDLCDGMVPVFFSREFAILRYPDCLIISVDMPNLNPQHN